MSKNIKIPNKREINLDTGKKAVPLHPLSKRGFL
jgi:hypothetical protein